VGAGNLDLVRLGAEGTAAAADNVASTGHRPYDRDDADDASYREALARLAGLLADIPFILVLVLHVPTEKVVTDWRLPVPPGLRLLGVAGHQADRDGPPARRCGGTADHPVAWPSCPTR
jgi:hypothetical protein